MTWVEGSLGGGERLLACGSSLVGGWRSLRAGSLDSRWLLVVEGSLGGGSVGGEVKLFAQSPVRSRYVISRRVHPRSPGQRKKGGGGEVREGSRRVRDRGEG